MWVFGPGVKNSSRDPSPQWTTYLLTDPVPEYVTAPSVSVNVAPSPTAAGAVRAMVGADGEGRVAKTAAGADSWPAASTAVTRYSHTRPGAAAVSSKNGAAISEPLSRTKSAPPGVPR